MANVWLLSAPQDAETADRVTALLETAGWTVKSFYSFGVAKSFKSSLSASVTASRAVVVIWSKASAASESLRYQARSAMAEGKLLPLLAPGASLDDAPIFARDLETLSLADWDGGPGSPVGAALLAALAEQADAAPSSAARREAPLKKRRSFKLFRRRAAPEELENDAEEISADGDAMAAPPAPPSAPPTPAPDVGAAPASSLSKKIGAKRQASPGRAYTPRPDARDRKVFIAHGAPDKPRIKPILEVLIDQGFQIWIDKPAFLELSAERETHVSRIAMSEDWGASIVQAVKATDIVCAFWSHDVVASRRERFFWEAYQGLLGENLFQVLLDPALDIGLPWTYRQIADLSDFAPGVFHFELEYLMQDMADPR